MKIYQLEDTLLKRKLLEQLVNETSTKYLLLPLKVCKLYCEILFFFAS